MKLKKITVIILALGMLFAAYSIIEWNENMRED